MLKLQASSPPIASSTHHDVRRKKGHHFKILSKLIRIPDLPILGLGGICGLGFGAQEMYKAIKDCTEAIRLEPKVAPFYNFRARA